VIEKEGRSRSKKREFIKTEGGVREDCRTRTRVIRYRTHSVNLIRLKIKYHKDEQSKKGKRGEQRARVTKNVEEKTDRLEKKE